MSQAARINRDRGGGSHLARSGPWNEGFSFDSIDQLQLIKKLHPELADPDPKARRAAWVKWGQTSIGRKFRAR